MLLTMLKLTENDKRLIIVLLLLVILIFIIAGYLGLLIKKIMKKQGEKMDTLIHDVVVTNVVKNEKELIKYGIKKNHQYFFKKAWIPMAIMAFSSLIIILYCIVYNNWRPDFNDYNETGFNTLFFVFDWKNAPRVNFFGKSIISDWPSLLNKPHWSWKAWGAYLFIPGMITGGVWFLIHVQAYIARTLRLFKKSKEVFSKSLDNFNVNETPQVNPNQPL